MTLPIAVCVSGRGTNLQALMATAIVGEGPELVVLAGYDRILSDAFWDRLGDIPVINIHPSLLPAFGGLGMMGQKVHEAVLAAGAAETGATVHRAHRGVLDEGEILLQRRVPVRPGDDAEALAARVLAVEHELLVEAVRRFAREGSPIA